MGLGRGKERDFNMTLKIQEIWKEIAKINS